ncbi:MAG: helix-turn-helix transcriptional regulator [Candidatus Cloacimonetes bacterium]|nr:helix-turn-helix transcriptional regulator [Candidatus Cloacimonadota bacterium]
MSKNLQDSINNIFGKKPSADQKAWGIINQFYHMVMTKMEEDGISRADLARNLGKSRAAVSQMFNKTPNISIKKMIEIADAVQLEVNLTADLFLQEKQIKEVNNYVFVRVNTFQKKSINSSECKIIHVNKNMESNYTLDCCGFN